jgi:hypothetical protein
VNTGCLDGELEPGRLGMGSEPGSRGGVHAPRFLRIDHLEWMSEVGTALLLYLDDHDTTAPAEDEVELEAGRTCVRSEKAVAAEPVVAKGAPLAAIHAAS